MATLVANWLLWIGGIVGAALLTSVVLLVRGLQWWQVATITASFAFLLVMLGAAIYHGNKRSSPVPTAPTPEDDAPVLLPFLDPTREYSLEERTQARLVNEFNNMTWSQQAALALLHNFAGLQASSLKQLLVQRGFGSEIDETIIKPLLRSSFVEHRQDGHVSPHPAHLAFITKLVKMWQRRGI